MRMDVDLYCTLVLFVGSFKFHIYPEKSGEYLFIICSHSDIINQSVICGNFCHNVHIYPEKIYSSYVVIVI